MGTSSLCFVHAEMQQIVHYTHHPHYPQPRFIGCSKSACYLCDMFIQKQGLYQISHAHRRLYEKWTLPDVNCASSLQAQDFPIILGMMAGDLVEAIRSLRLKGCTTRLYETESRAFLPLSSGSTASNVSTSAISQPLPTSQIKLSSFLPSQNNDFQRATPFQGKFESMFGQSVSLHEMTWEVNQTYQLKHHQ